MVVAIWLVSFASLILAGWFWQAARTNMRSALTRFVNEEEARVALGYVAWDPTTTDVARTYLIVSSAFAFIGMISSALGLWLAGASVMAALLMMGSTVGFADVLWKWLSFKRRYVLGGTNRNR
ncbi:hypothetical protein MRA01_63520 [Methylobacterium radiotolerans]|nr:hypothetical protein MRA01_63520 [Methylobacterium radiotolerans]